MEELLTLVFEYNTVLASCKILSQYYKCCKPLCSVLASDDPLNASICFSRLDFFGLLISLFHPYFKQHPPTNAASCMILRQGCFKFDCHLRVQTPPHPVENHKTRLQQWKEYTKCRQGQQVSVKWLPHVHGAKMMSVISLLFFDIVLPITYPTKTCSKYLFTMSWLGPPCIAVANGL